MKTDHPLFPVMQPQDMNAAFADAYNARDFDRVLALFEPESIHIHPNGTIEQGTAIFRNTLHEFFEQNGTLVSNNIYCIPFEDLALLRAHYILERRMQTEILFEWKDILQR